MKFLTFLVFLFASDFVYADVVNKCVDAKGKITFTDKVCKHEQNSTTVKINKTNIVDSSADRRAMYELNVQQHQQAQANYYKSLKYASDRSRARAYDEELKRKNSQRMNQMNMYYPNSNTAYLATHRTCPIVANQIRCY